LPLLLTELREADVLAAVIGSVEPGAGIAIER
jgi:hypothetical protein